VTRPSSPSSNLGSPNVDSSSPGMSSRAGYETVRSVGVRVVSVSPFQSLMATRVPSG